MRTIFNKIVRSGDVVTDGLYKEKLSSDVQRSSIILGPGLWIETVIRGLCLHG